MPVRKRREVQEVLPVQGAIEVSSLKSIEEQWQGFAAMVFKGMTPAPNQEAEMKKAFFAGAWAVFCAVEEIGEPHVPEAEGFKWLDERKAECLAFKRKILDEYAETN